MGRSVAAVERFSAVSGLVVSGGVVVAVLVVVVAVFEQALGWMRGHL